MRKLGLMVLGMCTLCACKSESKREATPAPSQASGAAPAEPPKPEAEAVAKPAEPVKPAEPPDVAAKVTPALSVVRRMAAEAVVVKAVHAQNGKKVGLDKIKELDVEWTAATGIIDKMKPYLDNDCAKALAKYSKELPALVEAFAMDNQGAIVCATAKTTDYWQGDEDKWQKSFAGGKGAEFVDKPKFDESSQSYSVQVSLPISDGKTVIGAITVGLSIDKL